MLVGRATRLARFLSDLAKRYTGSMRLGESRDTDDGTGTVTASSSAWHRVSTDAVRAAMQSLTGRVTQHPPVYSAKKVDGERAYRLARRGATVTLFPREVEVHRFTLVGHDGPNIRFAADVGSGVYLRALARDLGANLGCGAYLAELRRVSVGPFQIEDAVRLDALREPLALSRPAELVRHLPAVHVDSATRQAVAHGRPIAAVPGMPGPVALFWGDQLMAVAMREAGVLKPRVVLQDG